MWKRSGYCCRCGDCCIGDPFNGEEGLPAIEGRCPLFRFHHTPDGNEEGLCIGHEPPNQHPYYLNGCNVWPSDPRHIAHLPRCTYKFEWVSDGDENPIL